MAMSEIIDPTQSGNNRQQRLLFVAPILPGRSEAWRRSVQELLGSRHDAHCAARRQLGIAAEEVWLIATRRSDWTVIAVDLAQPLRPDAMPVLGDDAFCHWLALQLKALHGITVETGLSPAQVERVHAWHA